MSQRFTHRVAACLIAAAVCSQICFAQTSTAQITGTVTDASRAAVPDARVTAENVATGIQRSTNSGAEGYYTIPYLQPGKYEITVQKEGFRPISRSGITLNVSQSARIDFVLEVGTVTETLKVDAQAPLIQSADSAVGSLVESRRIMDLPLNGRDAFALAGLAPGVNPTGGGATPHISGSQTSTSEVQIDGASAVTANVIGGLNRLVYEPQVDAVQEFSVQVNGLAAEYGRFAGGVLNVVTKSGTNVFHGTAYDFLRNSELDANNFFANRAGQGKGSFKRNQWGGTVGGPVWIPPLYNGKDKTFFFVGYEATNVRSQSVFAGTVPIPAWRAGDFSTLRNASGNLIAIYDPLTVQADPSNPGQFIRSPFPNNIIPQDRPSSVAMNAVKFFPAPNAVPVNAYTNVNNFVLSGTAPSNNYRVDSRLDQNWSEKLRTSLRISRSWNDATAFNAFANAATPGDGGGVSSSDAWSATLDNTISFSPTLVADVRYLFSRNHYDRSPFGVGFDVTSLGMPGYLNENGAAGVKAFPRMDFAGALSTLGQYYTPDFEAYTNHAIAGSLIKVFTRHTMKVGGEYRKFFVNYKQLCCSTGAFYFNPGWTQHEINTPSATAGSPIASFLLGLANSANTDQAFAPAVASPYYAAYVQDDWKITSKLTLNLGLRYEISPPHTERYDRLSYFNPYQASPIAGSVPPPACAACGNLLGAMNFTTGSSRRQFPTNWTNVGPRFGFAYSVTAKTVLRGGFGIVYPPSPLSAGGASIGVAGYGASTGQSFSYDSGRTIVATLSNPFPFGFVAAQGRVGGAGTFLGLGPGDSVFLNNKSPYVEQWNLNIQRSLPGSVILEVGYVGSHGINLIDGDSVGESDTLDQIAPQYMSLGSKLLDLVPNPFYGTITNPNSPLSAQMVQYGQLLRPYPQYTDVGLYRRPEAQSIYHSLTIRAEKRFSHGLSFLLAYTAGKSIDDGSSVAWWEGPQGGGIMDQYNRRLDRSVSPWDVSQRLVISYVYELPFGKGRRFANKLPGGANLLISGWQFNGISTFQTGTPLIIGTLNNNTGAYSVAQRPNNNGQTAAISDPTIDRWFNTSVFSQPASYTFGNTARTLPDVRNPGVANNDLSLFKNTYIGSEGRLNLQYRLEMFNAFNTAQFAGPGAIISTGNFGVISSVATPSRQIQMALKLLW
jgi:hypothetical protein